MNDDVLRTKELDEKFPGWSVHFPTLWEFIRSREAQAKRDASGEVRDAVAKALGEEQHWCSSCQEDFDLGYDYDDTNDTHNRLRNKINGSAREAADRYALR